MKNSAANQPSPVIKLALAGIVAIGLWYLNEGLTHLSMKVNELPIEGMANATDAAAPAPAAAGLRTMHPLMVETSQKMAQRQASVAAQGPDSSPEPQTTPPAAANLDTLFGRDAAQKEVDERKAKEEAQAKELAKAAQAPQATPALPPMPVFDGFKALPSRVRVQALMPGGAVINGHFQEVGSVVKSLSYQGLDNKMHPGPVLTSVGSDSVTLTEATGARRSFVAKMLP